MIAAIIVTHDSAAVLDRCLTALATAAPRRGTVIRVVDNASHDDSAAIAMERLGAEAVVRLEPNRGFAAGVNAGMRGVEMPWIASINPDAIVPPGGLDRLADILESRPRAALVGPRVLDSIGRAEESVGMFPTLGRERAHALMLDRLVGLPGRHGRFPRATSEVDWVSGCAWLLRAEAAREVGPLDEEYFMYWEDVDYCRRLRDAGWKVLATPDVELIHEIGRGSGRTVSVPADGGRALLHYFAKFHPGESQESLRDWLLLGWRLRLAWRRLRFLLGDAASDRVAERYRLAIGAVGAGA
jgi:GT2 family glycosyltransferase